MTDYTINSLPSGTTSTATGSRNDGLQFTVDQDCTLSGIAYYVPSGETTLAGSSYTATLYSTTDGATGTQIAQATGTGTFTAGAWNWIAFSQAITSGVTYVAAIHHPNLLQFHSSYWGAGVGPFTNGPITVPSEAGSVGTKQQPTLTGATAFPSNANNPGSWYGVDIKVTVPDGGVGAVTLKKMTASGSGEAGYTVFNQQTNWSLAIDANAYTLGMQFSVSETALLTGIWYHSASGATALPTECVLWNADTQTQISGTLNASPSWSGVAGSGWVRCAYDGTITLVPGTNYVVSVLYDAADANWYSENNNYWTSGAGGSGITNGILTAPNSAGALNGQAIYHAGSTLTFPTTTTTGYDFGVDVEVVPGIVTGTGSVTLKKMTVSGSGTVSGGGGGSSVTQTILGQGLPGQLNDGTIGSGSFGGNLASEFVMLSDQPLTGIWFYSIPGAGALPSACAVYDINTSSVVAQNLSPTWSGAAGSGWVKCSFDGSVVLDTRSTGYSVVVNVAATIQNSGNPAGSLLLPVYGGCAKLTGANYDTNGSIDRPSVNPSTTVHYYVDVEVTKPSPVGFRAACDTGANDVPQSTHPTLKIPDSVQADDFMVVGVNLFGYSGDTGINVVITPGVTGNDWTQLSPTEYYEDGSGTGNISTHGIVFVRQATSDDAGSTLTFSYTGTPGVNEKWWAISFAAYQGLDSANALIAGSSGTSGTTVTTPALATGADDSWGIIVAPTSPAGGGNVDVTAFPAGYTWRVLSDRYSSGPSCMIADTNGSVGISGTAVGGKTITATNNQQWYTAFTLAVPPLAPSGSSTGAVTLKKIQAAGTGSVTIPFSAVFSSTTSGVDTYTVTASGNTTGGAGPQSMRVLTPDSPAPGHPHGFLYLLPVEPGPGSTYGDPIAICQAQGFHNTYNLTCIEMEFPVDPWFADNDTDFTTQQDATMVAVRNWAKDNLSISGTESHYLIGFSKSGIGGQQLQFRHPDLFDKVGSWDFPGDFTSYDRFGTDSTQVYGSQANFAANYEMNSTNINLLKDPFLATNRIWLGGFNSFTAEVDDYDLRLTGLSIPHTYTYKVSETHQWAADWMGAALTDMVPSVSYGAVTLKKMTVSGSGDVTSNNGTAAVTFKKMTVTATGNLTITGSGGVTFEKMFVVGIGKIKIAGSGAVTFKKMRVNEQGGPTKASTFFMFSPL